MYYKDARRSSSKFTGELRDRRDVDVAPVAARHYAGDDDGNVVRNKRAHRRIAAHLADGGGEEEEESGEEDEPLGHHWILSSCWLGYIY